MPEGMRATDRRDGTGTPKALVIGAGIGGLASALRLAANGFSVTVAERQATPGGKMREIFVAGRPIDSGPTVLTMRWVFDALFEGLGERLDDHITLRPAGVLARHSWEDGSVFDLHADVETSAKAVADFAGSAEAARFRAFCARTAEVYKTLEKPFLETANPSPVGLARAAGLTGIPALMRIRAFSTLWKVSGDYFRDLRLRQLFGRYSTYCGSSPFAAPGPLMLIAHVEQRGVWLVEGGMFGLARALEKLARQRGVTFRYEADVASIAVRNGKATGATLASGETIDADLVIANCDPVALSSGGLGEPAQKAVPGWAQQDRSLSAFTLSFVARTKGFPLTRHNVFFSDDYRREFDDIFGRKRLPSRPTVYLCAQDRDASGRSGHLESERLFTIVNAPATGDSAPPGEQELEQCQSQVIARLARAGLTVEPVAPIMRTTPVDFANLFPGTGGALYGRSSHGWMASFQRPGARTAIPGLYLTGGAVHPGPGVPMAALSGRHAAEAAIRDFGSTATFHPTAMPGGTSTRSATTAKTR